MATDGQWNSQHDPAVMFHRGPCLAHSVHLGGGTALGPRWMPAANLTACAMHWEALHPPKHNWGCWWVDLHQRVLVPMVVPQIPQQKQPVRATESRQKLRQTMLHSCTTPTWCFGAFALFYSFALLLDPASQGWMKGEIDRCLKCHSHPSKAAADSCMSPYAYSSALCFLELGCQSETKWEIPRWTEYKT